MSVGPPRSRGLRDYVLEDLRPTFMTYWVKWAGRDRLAIGAITALRDHGRACPHDISVSGYNDMDFVDRIDPPLTTVRIQKREAGARAAAILLDRLADPRHAPEHVVLPVELIVRGSTAPARRRHVAMPSHHVA